MDQTQKDQIYSSANATLHNKTEYFKDKIKDFEAKMEELRKLAPELLDERDKVDPGTEQGRILFAKADIRQNQVNILNDLVDTPYFSKCTVKFNDNPNTERELFFGKHSWIEQDIMSWVSPVSTIRFEELGDFAYTKPDGEQKKGKLVRKQTYIITGSEIVYLTNEDFENGKELIYQKHLAERKQFALPEIVAELEKAQDQIIRSDPKGGLLISGSAGSGKTTLALHRIAYLVYSPEFKEFFEPERIVAFVTDHSAIKYFSKLLPDLGISGVNITTFSDWGVEIVNNHYRSKFKSLHLQDAVEQIEAIITEVPVDARILLDEFRKAKIESLDVIDKESLTVDKLFEAYIAVVSDKIKGQFKQFVKFQQEFKLIDDIDISILLSPFERPTRSFKHIVVDEVQNWTPLQLDIIQRIVEPMYKSVSYIGDIKQRTKAFTIHDWNELESDFPIDNVIELTKVYRNTKQILRWLNSRGYNVDPDSTDRESNEVEAYEFDNLSEQKTFITNFLRELSDSDKLGQIGILAKYNRSLRQLSDLDFAANVHLMTIEQAQGLEFSTVILIDAQDLEVGESKYQEEVSYLTASEYTSVDKQLFYVGATRAEEKLIVCKVK